MHARRFPPEVAAALLADKFKRDEVVDWKLEISARRGQEAAMQAEVTVSCVHATKGMARA